MKKELLERVVSELKSRQVAIAQALVERDEEHAFDQAGFHDAGELVYMIANGTALAPLPTNPVLEFTVVAPHSKELAAVVSETYGKSLDFPLVDGWRDLDDVLAGYRGTGVFRPELWRLVRWQNEVIGCLLLADFPQQSQGELVYLGIRPEFRGRGWGKSIAAWAINCAVEMGWQQFVLAVDANNWPARRIYEKVGFTKLDTRRLFVCKV